MARKSTGDGSILECTWSSPQSCHGRTTKYYPPLAVTNLLTADMGKSLDITPFIGMGLVELLCPIIRSTPALGPLKEERLAQLRYMNRATSILSARAFWSDDIVEQFVSSVISAVIFTLSLMESVGDGGLVKVWRTTFESSHQSSTKDLGRHFRITGISASAENLFHAATSCSSLRKTMKSPSFIQFGRPGYA